MFLGGDIEVRNYTLGEVCEIISGVGFSKDGFKKEGIPILKVGNIQENKVNTINLDYWDPNDKKKSSLIKRGDIVMAKTGKGSIGKVGINLTDLEFFFDPNVFKIEPNPEILDKRFLYHFLLNNRKEIENLIITGAQHSLRKTDFEKFVIPIPSLDIQIEIADKLDKFGEIEREIEREIILRQKQYEYYRNTLINQS